MSKALVISKILALPLKDQRAILQLLQSRFQEDIVLTRTQEQEMERRLERIDKEGFHGEPWDVVEKRLRKVIKNARRSPQLARRG